MRQGSLLVVYGEGREMYGVELYREVRLAVVDEGLSHREAARRFGIDRRTVKKMLSYSAPPGYRRSRPVRRPKLAAFTGIIDAILTADGDVPRKQRHTAQRIFERLRDEQGFTGGYTIVKDYVRERHLSTREAFVPLHHPPGHAQADFGQAVVDLGGQRQKVHFFCMILPHSNAWFVKAYPRETTEAFLDGHVSAFAFFGVAALTAAEGESVEVATTAVYELPKDATAVIALGDRVSWDDAAKQIKPPAVGLYPVGIVTEAAGSGVTPVKVRLDGIATQAAG